MRRAAPANLTTCVIDMRFEAASLPQALELLVSAAGPVQARPGCRVCRVSSDATEAGVLTYWEVWDSEAAFRRHVRSEDFWRVLVAMDLCAEPPEVTIGQLTATGGMAYLQKLRLGGAEPEGPEKRS